MTKKKAEKKDKALLSEILKDERDKEIEELSGENGRLRAEAERKRTELSDMWVRYQTEREGHEESVIRLNDQHREATRRNQELLDSKNREIDSLRARLKDYATWVGRILQGDFQIQPPEVALSKVAFVLELLRASLSGQTLEGAMQRLGYLETVFGFEAGPPKRKIFLVINKTDKLYKTEEGQAKMLEPPSTQIYGIKELRAVLNIGLREAKEITDRLHEGSEYKFECPDLETAQRAAGELKKTGYFMASIVEE